jgi:poly-gamma-glutamate capsule biosynthesis protein CapA/YwtB (metallophosphatase superfamily)
VKRPSRLSHPFALVSQGFIAAALVFVAVDPTLVGAGASRNDAQATAQLAELTR